MVRPRSQSTNANSARSNSNVADPILAAPLRPIGGMIIASARAGIGFVWDDAAVARYRVA